MPSSDEVYDLEVRVRLGRVVVCLGLMASIAGCAFVGDERATDKPPTTVAADRAEAGDDDRGSSERSPTGPMSSVPGREDDSGTGADVPPSPTSAPTTSDGRPVTPVPPGDFGLFCVNSWLAMVDMNRFDAVATEARFDPGVVVAFADTVVGRIRRAAEGFPDDPLRADIDQIAIAYEGVLERMRGASNADELRQVLDDPTTTEALQATSGAQERISGVYSASCPDGM